MNVLAERLAFYFERRGADVTLIQGRSPALHAVVPGDGETDRLQVLINFTPEGRVRRTGGAIAASAVANAPRNPEICAAGSIVALKPRTLRELMRAVGPHLPYEEVWHPVIGKPDGRWTVYQVPALVGAQARADEGFAEHNAVTGWVYTPGIGWWQFL